jgi:hypothetical protein
VGDGVVAVSCVLAALAYTSGAAPERHRRSRATTPPTPNTPPTGAPTPGN